MAELSDGKQRGSRLNNLKEIIKTVKNDYDSFIPNYKKWPCPFCINHSKTELQYRMHIRRNYPNICKAHKTVLAQFNNIYNDSYNCAEDPIFINCKRCTNTVKKCKGLRGLRHYSYA